VAAAAIVFAVYRGYGRLLERKAALHSVHEFSRTLDDGRDSEALLEVVLSQVPTLINATRAEAFLLGANGLTRRRLVDEVLTLDASRQSEWPLQEVLESGRPRLLSRHSGRRSVRQVLRDNSVRQAMIAPLPGPAGVAGALIVTDRRGYVRGFRRSDLLLFETLARHAGAALAKASLVQELRRDAEYDRLTGLLNRQGVANAVDGMEGGMVAVLLLQVSGILEVNDALGHQAGDRLLQAAACRVRAALRNTTAVGRLDGDVFAVLLRGRDVDEAISVAERLIAVVTEPVELEEVPLALGGTAGVARGDASSLLIRQAEIALRATQRDGGLVGVYDRAMEPPSVRRLSIAAELQRALADPQLAQQVVPFYQPKADLKTGCVQGVEALVRWRHPQRGLVPPGEFIPVVESTDLVRPLTLHVLDRALSDAARWADTGRPLTVAVNLSARSLYDPRLVRDVAGLLGAHAVGPERLTLEITEGTVMHDADRARHILEDLASIGVTVSVDDFGTGYSSLAYLARLPVSEVKVDRMFVSRMTSDSRDAAVVQSVIDLGHSLNLRVVAEGVEDQASWNALLSAGADVAQGFLLSRPLEVRVLEQWLDDRNSADADRAPCTPSAGRRSACLPSGATSPLIVNR
jgi:diguanylate cyclase (GGDEF)-like protein